MEENPTLRPVEAFPVKADGEDYICLRDPQGFASRPIFLNRVLVFLVSRMNGKNSLRDIQADYVRATGEILPMEQLKSLVEQLDEQLYLEGTRFEAFYARMVAEFLQAPARPAFHAGNAYESEAGALKDQIMGFYRDLEGPGLEPARDSKPPVRGLISPHIDFHRGGPTYAHAYGTLSGQPPIRRFLLFGTCHTPMRRRFALTRKHFETPLGRIETDVEFVERLASRLPANYFDDEISHRGEHSLEFQSVMLKYAMRQSESFTIVPVLVGSLHDIYTNGSTAGENQEILGLVEAIAFARAEMPGRDVVIAGADLAHVGRRFGDERGPTVDSMTEVARLDRKFLALVEAGDAEGMFQSIAAEDDRRHVCGYPPIYMALRVLGKTRGELLQYRQWTDFEAGAAVTFAALALY